MQQILTCPHCNRSCFTADLTAVATPEQPDDAHTYIELTCLHCHRQALTFVVNQQPEFEHADT